MKSAGMTKEKGEADMEEFVKEAEAAGDVPAAVKKRTPSAALKVARQASAK